MRSSVLQVYVFLCLSLNAFADEWQAVRDAIDASPVKECTVLVADGSTDSEHATPLFVHQKGTKVLLDSKISVASASKWLAAATIMRVVDAGLMTLDDTPSDHLPWWTADKGDARATITLAQLLAFTSGLEARPEGSDSANDPCVGNNTFTLESCAQTIYANNVNLVPPGTSFRYGGNHLHIAGAMTVQATGLASWAEVFLQYMANPLGLQVQLIDNIWTPKANPNVAGGFYGTAYAYLKFLRAIFLKPSALVTASSLVEMEVDHTPSGSVNLSYSPLGDIAHYGLGNWIECPVGTGAFSQVCTDFSTHSSTGKFGFYPWIDRRREFYGVIAASNLVGIFASRDSFELGQQVANLVADVLEARATANTTTTAPTPATGTARPTTSPTPTPSSPTSPTSPTSLTPAPSSSTPTSSSPTTTTASAPTTTPTSSSPTTTTTPTSSSPTTTTASTAPTITPTTAATSTPTAIASSGDTLSARSLWVLLALLFLRPGCLF